jgi:hypothetical protein
VVRLRSPSTPAPVPSPSIDKSWSTLGPVLRSPNPHRESLYRRVGGVIEHPPNLKTTMFFLHNLERRVTLHPSYFGRNMHELVTSKLLKDVEGTCAGNYYIISIMDTFDISEGRILPGSGLAEFTVGYRAVVWRPFKGETVCRSCRCCPPSRAEARG